MTEEHTPGRLNFPPHRTPASPPQSPNLNREINRIYLARRLSRRQEILSMVSVELKKGRQATLSGQRNKNEPDQAGQEQENILTFCRNIYMNIYTTLYLCLIVIIITATYFAEKPQNCSYTLQPLECALLLPAEQKGNRRYFTVYSIIVQYCIFFVLWQFSNST